MSETLDDLIAVVEAGKEINHLAILMPDQRTIDLLYNAHRGSLDAAKALQEALLPGWRMDALWQGGTLCPTEDGWSCRLRCITEKRQAIQNDERLPLPTAARAWLLAILRAYAARDAA